MVKNVKKRSCRTIKYGILGRGTLWAFDGEEGRKGGLGGPSREMWILLRRRRDRQGIKSVAEGEGTEGRRWHGLARFGGVLVSSEVDQR